MYHAVSHDDHDEHNSHEQDHSLKSRHSCTDVPCCLFFLLSLLCFGGLNAWIFFQTKGSPGRLFHGIDSEGVVCGADPGVENKSLLFWCVGVNASSLSHLSKVSALPSSLTLGRRVCVSQCPGSFSDSVQECSNEGSSSANGTVTSLEGYKSKEVLSRYCLPDVSEYRDAARAAMSSQLGGFDERAAESLSSLPSSWPAILGTLVLAIALGYVYLFLLRCCAEVLIWISIAICVLGLGALGAYLWLTAGSETLSGRLPDSLRPSSNSTDFTEDEEKGIRATACLCWCLSFVALCLACCLRHSIDAAAACLEVACEAIFEMPTLLLAPAVKATIKGVLSAGLLYGFLLLWSLGETAGYDMPLNSAMVQLNGTLPSDMEAPHLTHTQQQWILILFYMSMSFWILCFVNALYQFVVAYTVATYYYCPHEQDEDGNHTGEKDVEGCCTALEGLHVGILYHAGSLAFGSLLIAILRTIQKVIEYAQMKNKEAGDNQIVKLVLCVCGCCIKCLKDIVGFVNKNAYIDMAITSNGFCTAAQRALQMILELGGAMAVLNGATFVFSFFGVLFITVACAGGSYIAAGFPPFNDQSSTFFVEDPLALAAVAAVLAFLVALSFMDVLDMASDTLLYCYGVDLQSGKEDHNAPHALQELVNNHSNDHKSEDDHS
mmetsp:Transcript_51739/g.168150  ORF Transcript_51739/g.168150 Transcript_51739/m.168150 type:complete len:662 (+) Transcript_51739:221-2206(+)